MTICAIHQPNFFPWLGYFDKIRRADAFVFLDNVEYPKSGSGTGSWVNRARIAIAGSPAWVTCPIQRRHGPQIIRDVLIDDRQPWRKKLVRTLKTNYAKTRNYARVIPLLEKLIGFETDNLCHFNVNAITTICHLLGIECCFTMQSACNVSSSSTQLLIDLTRAVGAETYLCGGGASGYQRDEMFPENNLQLKYQDFRPEPYGDLSRFHAGLSAIDYLFHGEHLP